MSGDLTSRQGPQASQVLGSRRDVYLLMGAALLYSFNFTMLLPVTPVLVEMLGQTGVAGLVNTTLLVATVALQWLSPILLRHFTKKVLYILGLLLMGVPSLAYAALPESVSTIFIASVVRGAGFGILTVVAASLVIELSPPERHGRVMGTFGMATAVPAVFASWLGLQLLNKGSGAWPAILGFAVCVVAIVMVVAVDHPVSMRHSPDDADRAMPRTAVLRMMRNPELLALGAAFLLVSVAWGGTTSFLPLALPKVGLGSAATFLLVSGLLRVAGRWLAGEFVDRGVSASGASVPVVVGMAVGLTLIAINAGPVMVIASAAIYGLGTGLLQTFLFLATLRRSPYGHSAAAAYWATSLDLGGVVGTSALAGVAAVGGYSAVLWAMPVIVLAAAPLLIRPWRAEARAS